MKILHSICDKIISDQQISNTFSQKFSIITKYPFIHQLILITIHPKLIYLYSFKLCDFRTIKYLDFIMFLILAADRNLLAGKQKS